MTLRWTDRELLRAATRERFRRRLGRVLRFRGRRVTADRLEAALDKLLAELGQGTPYSEAVAHVVAELQHRSVNPSTEG